MENCVVKEKKGLSRYRKQLVFLMDLFLANIVYFVMIYWVPIRNGTTIQQVIDWMPNFGLMLLCLCGFLWASKSYDSLWRYAETDEYISMILMGALAYVVYFILAKAAAHPQNPQRAVAVHLLDVAFADDDRALYLPQISHEGKLQKPGAKGALRHHRRGQRGCQSAQRDEEQLLQPLSAGLLF